MGRKRVAYYIDKHGVDVWSENFPRLSGSERQKIAAYVQLLERDGEDLRRPVADYLGGKLYELRPKQHRVLYFFLDREYAVVVSIFHKTTAGVPPEQMRLANARRIDFVQRYRNGEIRLQKES